jgi:acetylornithine/LysW-gamma-L-lysine aminotransferase
VNILGHAHPEVNAAARAQLERLTNAHQSFETPARREFLDALAAVIPPALSAVSFANSGAEAVEAALKYARVASGRPGVIATHRAYHGRTFGALAATAEARYRDPFSPMLEGFRHIPFDDLDALDAVIDEQVGAVILEPIQGEAGVRIPSPGYLRGVRERCDAHDALLILDEVQTGFRTGAPLAFTESGILPDILCLSKSIANGLPLGVTLTTPRVAERVPRGSHGSTFAGSPLVCAAATATLRLLADPAIHEHAKEMGGRFHTRLAGMRLPEVREVRGRGLMLAVELKRQATPVIKAMQQHGVLTLPAGPTTIRFLPSVLVQADEIDLAIGALAEAVAEVASGLV